MPPVGDAPVSGGGGVVGRPSPCHAGLCSAPAAPKWEWLLGQGRQDEFLPHAAEAHPALWPGFPAETEVMGLCSDRGALQHGCADRQPGGNEPGTLTAKQRFHRCHVACKHLGRTGQADEEDVRVFPGKDRL